MFALAERLWNRGLDMVTAASPKEVPRRTVSLVEAGPRRVSRSVAVAAAAAELFALVADPRRHHDLDGSGTVRENIAAPAKLVAGDRFSTKIRMFGVPCRITSTVTP
jgi:hypothetical protein